MGPMMDGGVEPQMSGRLLYTIEGARQMLGGLARSYVYELLARGAIRSVKIGRRRMIARRDLEEFVERLRECGGEGAA
jgi:excisionase family DNA binding protein